MLLRAPNLARQKKGWRPISQNSPAAVGRGNCWLWPKVPKLVTRQVDNELLGFFCCDVAYKKKLLPLNFFLAFRPPVVNFHGRLVSVLYNYWPPNRTISRRSVFALYNYRVRNRIFPVRPFTTHASFRGAKNRHGAPDFKSPASQPLRTRYLVSRYCKNTYFAPDSI